jgi:glyoxylate reductase
VEKRAAKWLNKKENPMKPKILITRKILTEALDYLHKHTDYEIGATDRNLTKQEIIEKIGDKEGLLSFLVDTIDKEILNSAQSLKIIANCAVGYNNIDIEEAKKRGILVTNTPGVLTETTADLTWALILAVARRIPGADRFTREKKFKGWELDLFLGKEVTGKRLGIIGMGRIGKKSKPHTFLLKNFSPPLTSSPSMHPSLLRLFIFFQMRK